jgi:hypothetical protein
MPIVPEIYDEMVVAAAAHRRGAGVYCVLVVDFLFLRVRRPDFDRPAEIELRGIFQIQCGLLWWLVCWVQIPTTHNSYLRAQTMTQTPPLVSIELVSNHILLLVSSIDWLLGTKKIGEQISCPNRSYMIIDCMPLGYDDEERKRWNW